MDRHLPPAAACGIHAKGRGANPSLSHRARRKPCVSFAVPAGLPGQHAWLRRHRSRPYQRGSRRRGGMGELRRGGAGAASAHPARLRAESHVRLASTTPGGTMCWRAALTASSRTISTSAARRTSPSRFTSARWRTPMARRSRRASSSSKRAAAGRGSCTSTTAGRCRRRPGARCSMTRTRLHARASRT